MLTLSDFDYSLPKEMIAAYPPEDRPSARLLHVNRESGKFAHHTFRDITDFLQAGDLLVLNNTKVLPARIFGKKETGGGVEGLLLKDLGGGKWKALLRPGGRVKKNTVLSFGQNGTSLSAEVLEDSPNNSGERVLQFSGEKIHEKLKAIGHIPLPPYIDREDTEIDREFYQTVFAEKDGAVASPTAGLHFDQGLLEAINKKGIETVCVTLHTGYGTFQPVTSENLSEHRMFEEEFEITEEAAGRINQAKQDNRRIIACGTTSVRALESAAGPDGKIIPQKNATRLFVYPPYEFKMVQGLITNFHLPKSSLLLLVAAFLGHDKMLKAYSEAIRKKYRFYSYGDAMVIL
ncbi:MAG: tRNA preQ1(34) S-adenosylmethionine ribosyltransferase-isomerase QueA [Candidatus Omnitrophica bacterium]|nr:tRNA preQ1(34) S-adenosylmethionine ribosyltransferase-isomerase QueA [Candidatus Omnitrophota bacterium]